MKILLPDFITIAQAQIVQNGYPAHVYIYSYVYVYRMYTYVCMYDIECVQKYSGLYVR